MVRGQLLPPQMRSPSWPTSTCCSMELRSSSRRALRQPCRRSVVSEASSRSSPRSCWWGRRRTRIPSSSTERAVHAARRRTRSGKTRRTRCSRAICSSSTTTRRRAICGRDVARIGGDSRRSTERVGRTAASTPTLARTSRPRRSRRCTRSTATPAAAPGRRHAWFDGATWRFETLDGAEAPRVERSATSGPAPR